MTVKTSLDKAGRIVLPKPLRDKMRLSPGDSIVLECEGEQITLRPDRPRAILKKEHGVWVYQGEPSALSLPDWIELEREKRLREIIG